MRSVERTPGERRRSFHSPGRESLLKEPLRQDVYQHRWETRDQRGRHHQLPTLPEQALGLGGRIVDPVPEVVDAGPVIGIERRAGRALPGQRTTTARTELVP